MENFCGYDIDGFLPSNQKILIVQKNNFLYSLKVYPIENYKEIDVLFRLHHPTLIHGINILSNCSIEGTGILLPLMDGEMINLNDKPFNMLLNKEKVEIIYKLIIGVKYLFDNNIKHGKINIFYHIKNETHPYIYYQTSDIKDDIQIQLGEFLSKFNINDENELLYKDLIDKLLNLTDINTIIKHEFFDQYQLNYVFFNKEENLDVTIGGEYPPDTKEIIKNMILYIKENYKYWYVEYLFLAIELYRRVIPTYFERSNHERYIISYACIYIASQFSNYYRKIDKMNDIEKEKILERASEIVVILNGVLNINKWFNIANNIKDLSDIFNNIIISNDLYKYQNFNFTPSKIKDHKKILVKNFF